MQWPFFQAIVRGSKIGVDGSLTWLLDEFETMSVIRSNSLRRGSPPTQPRSDSGSSGMQENGEQPYRHHEHAGESRDRSVLPHTVLCFLSMCPFISDSWCLFLICVWVERKRIPIPRDQLEPNEKTGDRCSPMAKSQADVKSKNDPLDLPHHLTEIETTTTQWSGGKWPMTKDRNPVTQVKTKAHSPHGTRDLSLDQMFELPTYLSQRGWWRQHNKAGRLTLTPALKVTRQETPAVRWVQTRKQENWQEIFNRFWKIFYSVTSLLSPFPL